MTQPTPSIALAVAAFNAAVAAVGTIAGAPKTDLIPILTSGQILQTAFASEAAAQDAIILANPLNTPDGGVTSLPSTLAAIEAEVSYLNASYYYGRAVVNVQNDLG